MEKKTFWDCIIDKTPIDLYVVGKDNKTIRRMTEISFSWDSRSEGLTLWDCHKPIITITKPYKELQSSIIQSTSVVTWCLYKEDIAQCCVDFWQKKLSLLADEANQLKKQIGNIQGRMEELARQIKEPQAHYKIVNYPSDKKTL